MRETLEVKESLWPKFLTILAFVVIIIGGVYLAFFHNPQREGSIFTPGELRKVVNEYRERQAEKLRGELAEMQTMLDEMRGIRNQWVDKAQIDDDFERVLGEEERQMREAAAQVGDDLEELHQVYDAGRAVEQDMLTVYREFLGARLVNLRPMLTYDEAYENSETPRPDRPALDTEALYRDITTTEPGGGLEEFKAQIKLSTIEMREMKENAKKLLIFTRRSNSQAGDGIDVDLSSDDVAMIGHKGPELMPEEIDYTHEGDPGNYDAVPGRSLVTGPNAANEWMYVDSWYVIGPFEGDRRREKLDVRFGPEANVNLDDVFTGKKTRVNPEGKVRWDYKKVGHVEQTPGGKTAYWKIEPREVETYAIYYAYTEIYSDLPRLQAEGNGVWIATGTDDYGKLWVNDNLVWTSPKERKPYHATENVRLIDLQQGQNKILYRVENAGGTMGFSLMMRLAE